MPSAVESAGGFSEIRPACQGEISGRQNRRIGHYVKKSTRPRTSSGAFPTKQQVACNRRSRCLLRTVRRSLTSPRRGTCEVSSATCEPDYARPERRSCAAVSAWRNKKAPPLSLSGATLWLDYQPSDGYAILLYLLRLAGQQTIKQCAGDGTRTRTTRNRRWNDNPACLPIPPPPHIALSPRGRVDNDRQLGVAVCGTLRAWWASARVSQTIEHRPIRNINTPQQRRSYLQRLSRYSGQTRADRPRWHGCTIVFCGTVLRAGLPPTGPLCACFLAHHHALQRFRRSRSGQVSAS
jgi:hypothetical protein